MEFDVQDSRPGTLWRATREKDNPPRHGDRNPPLGHGDHLWLRTLRAEQPSTPVLLVLIGVLILEAGVWGLTSGILPSERRYLGLREEGDHFLRLIRVLNAAAVARDEGQEDDMRFRETQAQMHTSVDRMAELAGQEKGVANTEVVEASAVGAEASAVEAEASRVEQSQNAVPSRR